MIVALCKFYTISHHIGGYKKKSIHVHILKDLYLLRMQRIEFKKKTTFVRVHTNTELYSLSVFNRILELQHILYQNVDICVFC